MGSGYVMERYKKLEKVYMRGTSHLHRGIVCDGVWEESRLYMDIVVF